MYLYSSMYMTLYMEERWVWNPVPSQLFSTQTKSNTVYLKSGGSVRCFSDWFHVYTSASVYCQLESTETRSNSLSKVEEQLGCLTRDLKGSLL